MKETKVKKTLDEYINEDLELTPTDIAKMVLARIYNHIDHAEIKKSDVIMLTDDGKMWWLQGVTLGGKDGETV
jgi:hypothetical protein